MGIEVRTVRPDEVGAALAPIWHYFGRGVNEEDVERIGRILPPERLHAAFADGAVVGGAGAYALELTVPGGAVVPTAGVMAVGVLPTHRRRGVLTELMRRQLDDARKWGEPLALLYASEGAIYGRYGYGIASLAGEISAEREHAAFDRAPQPVGVSRLVSHEEALELFPQVYDRVRAETPGMFARSRDWWEVRRLTSRPWMGGAELMRVVLEVDGRPEAYAVYSIGFAAEYGASTATLRVVEAMGTSPAPTSTIWRYLFETDWYLKLECDFLPLDHPLFFLVREPRRLRFTLGEALWARLVAVGEALSARSFADEEPVVLELADDFCPWNEGRWRVAPDEVERTEADADLRVDVRELGSVYLGGFSFGQLARAGRIEELREGALARADDLFRTDRQPWCPELF
ncbi:MAG: GNAT family N-acetyltransferase [Actinomycetota bacterium]|nr:GNAT family N-acetyltransferase [Actinomycetota bacterium]